MRLAAVDDASNVLYLARPCQFRPPGTRDSCDTSFWTTHRFAESVVAALDGAIDRALPPSPRRRLTLIGYSGGGGLAVLLAARRSDVVAVVTVAGNIAHGVWTSHHKVSPLKGSLDPIDSAGRLAEPTGEVLFFGGAPKETAAWGRTHQYPLRDSLLHVFTRR